MCTQIFIYKKISINIIVDGLNNEDADIVEESLINTYYDDIYNISKNSHGGDNISYNPRNKEIRQKLSESSKEMWKDNEKLHEKHSKEMTGEGNPMYGKHHTLESRIQMSETRKANPHQYTDEERKQISIRSKKIYSNPEIRQKLSNSLKLAYKDNDELRKTISNASKEHWKDQIYREKVIAAVRKSSEKYMKPVHGDGIDFKSIKEACNYTGLTIGAIINRCRSKSYPDWYYVNKENE